MRTIRLFGVTAVATAGLAMFGGLTLGSTSSRAQAFYDDRPSALMRDWSISYVPRSTMANVDGRWPGDGDRILYRGRTQIIVPVGPAPEGGRSFAVGIGATF